MTGPGGALAGSQSQQPEMSFDHTGQVAPPGMKPRVTATLWEDEGSLCFQVEAKGVCVARREGEDEFSIFLLPPGGKLRRCFSWVRNWVDVVSEVLRLPLAWTWAHRTC
jgi:hypothetical protein